jgi:hypothetical protein
MNEKHSRIRRIWIPIAAALMLSGAAIAQKADEKRVHVVVKHAGEDSAIEGNHWVHEMNCDGEECPEGARVLFIGEDGKVELPGGAHHWVSQEGDGGAFVVRRGGGAEFAFGRRALLGVQLTELTDQLRTTFGVPAGEGAMVSRVIEGSAAERSGLRAGDVITAVNGETVSSGGDLGARVGKLEDGATAALEVWRDGMVQQISATVEVPERSSADEGQQVIRIQKRKTMDCDEGGDCEVHVEVIDGGDGGFGELHEFDATSLCGGSDVCEVRVQCEEGTCSCTVNGEEQDCSGIPGLPE